MDKFIIMNIPNATPKKPHFLFMYEKKSMLKKWIKIYKYYYYYHEKL